MADPRFFTRAGPFALAELAAIAEADLADGADGDRLVHDVAPLDDAGPDHISFLDNRKYVAAFRDSLAGACVVSPAHADKAPAGMVLLLSTDPYRAYARVAAAFYPPVPTAGGIAPTAHVDETANLAADVEVGPGAVVGRGARIGPGTRIGPNAVIGDGVEIGARCSVGANATLSHSLLGDDVHIYTGCRIGQDGFGFAMGPAGHLKVPQLGRVVIGDDVEIGANTTIDRGAGPDTVIGPGCRIDNLVQIGHNVRLGRGCVVVSQVGISGSTEIGDFAAIGGQAGLVGHITVGPGARIAAQAGVSRDVPAGATVAGAPAMPAKEFWRQVATLDKLARQK